MDWLLAKDGNYLWYANVGRFYITCIVLFYQFRGVSYL